MARSLSSHLRRWISCGWRLVGAHRLQRGNGREYVRGSVVRSLGCAAPASPSQRGRLGGSAVLCPPAGLSLVAATSPNPKKRTSALHVVSASVATARWEGADELLSGKNVRCGRDQWI